MAFDSSVNKYVSLIDTIPELLVSLRDGDIPDQVKNDLSEKLQAYQKVVCEFGSGSGGHLLLQAKANPQTFYIGFELRYKRAYRTAEKAQQQGLTNLFIFRGDARLADQLFAPDSVSGVFVNFPDPWAKKNWKKHRILNLNFLTRIHEWLAPEGFFSHKSDHQEYFEETMELIERKFTSKGLFSINSLSRDLYNSEFAESSIPSEFEMLFKNKGLPICFVELRKNLVVSNPSRII